MQKTEEQTITEATKATETTETTEATEATEATETAETPEVPLTELSTDDLTKKRMGAFKVGMSYGDAVYYRNLLDKSEYTGPNQAYLLALAKTEMSQLCTGLKTQDKHKRYEVQLTSATIESLGFFINKHSGKGADSASKLFTASMLLRSVMGEINAIDEILSSRNEEVESNK